MLNLLTSIGYVSLAIWFMKIAFTEDLDNKTFWALIVVVCVSIVNAIFDYCSYLKEKLYE